MSSVELALYVFVYDNLHLVTLPWDSPWTWYICFFGVDFFYYWFHRAAHGRFINMFLVKKLPRRREFKLSSTWKFFSRGM